MQPVLGEPFAAGDDVHVLPTYWPVPGAGVLPMNAFLLRAAEPVLVDTGVGVLQDEFLDALTSLIDPADLRWIWLTHEDRDHTGSLQRLLELAPQARLAATFMAVGRTMPETPLPLDRVRIVNPGDTINVGDRNLRAVRPPLYDSPGTIGFLDDRTGTLFSSDCFGAPLPTPDQAQVRDVSEVPAETVAAGQTAWATVDSSWVTLVDPDKLRRAVDGIRRLEPAQILSSHLPPVRDRVDDVLKTVEAVPYADPVPPMTQAELEALLAGFEPAP
jgi:glyoxylase-like metal-dependent hydrolase (beta-lactamase superfamily II)